MNKKVKTKRKLKLRNFILLSFVFAFFCLFFLYCYTLPIKNIVIIGNHYISDYEIILACDIKDYPAIFRLSRRKMKEELSRLDYLKDYQIHRNLLGRFTIQIEEEIPLFYNRNKEKLIFESGKEITTQEIKGVPILINYVPDDLYERLLKEIKETNQDVLKLISEIEYSPWKTESVMIDDTRFFLRMNDGNVVYVNLINFEKLNNYMTIYSTLGNSKGILQLDSSLGNGITFSPF